MVEARRPFNGLAEAASGVGVGAGVVLSTTALAASNPATMSAMGGTGASSALDVEGLGIAVSLTTRAGSPACCAVRAALSRRR